MPSCFQLSDHAKDLKIARESDCTVLLLGETGTGKTRLAEEIHHAGPRKAGPFITVNLASIHAGTIESELFGHERGAFTGADQRRVGKLSIAHGGTVFLDEIGELPLPLQTRLLEFLQSRAVTPVGGNQSRKLDVRVIAATHQDLARKVSEGLFREDLYHRLRVVSLRLAPLRDYADKFGNAVHAVLEEVAIEQKKPVFRLSEEVADLLERHPLRGNFRELRHALEYGTLASKGGTLEVSDLPRWFIDACQVPSLLLTSEDKQALQAIAVAEVPLTLNFNETTARFESLYLAYVLERFRGRVNRTAREIGLSKATLIRRIRTHQLRPRFPIESGRVRSNE